MKVPYDSLTLRAVTWELAQRLVGGQIQEVRQPSQTDLLLGIRSQARSYLLLFSADAQFARVHLTGVKQPNPPTPPNFCMTVRKHCMDARVLGVCQRESDRILEMQIGVYEEGEERHDVTLIGELMGKHSNLILVDAEGRILDAAKRISHRINRVRETLPGLIYQPPPEQPDRIDPFLPNALQKITRELDAIPPGSAKATADALQQIFAGMSPFLALEIGTRAAAKEPEMGREAALRTAWESTLGAAAREAYAPVQIRDEHGKPLAAYPFSTFQVAPERQKPTQELNAALDEAYSALIARSRREAVQGELRGKIDREITRLEKLLAGVFRALEEAERAEEYRHQGELILANLWRIQPGDASVTVQDYFDLTFPDKEITLDPTQSPQANAEVHFRRYRKARESRQKEEERGVRIEADLARLRQAAEELPRLTLLEAVKTLREDLLRAGLIKDKEPLEGEERHAGPDFQGHKIRRYTSPEGFEIYVGESSTANDFLTTRIASPNDLWLHVRAAASAHVVIRTHGKPDQVPRSVLMHAAVLCALHSPQKHSSLVSVDYTLKKWVRKPRGSAPGAADYQKEVTLEVTPVLTH